jgi:hypothetical protein
VAVVSATESSAVASLSDPTAMSKSKSKPQASKSAKVSDDDLTPRATPNQSFSNSFNQSLNRTSELYSSEEETPRPTVNRSLQNNKPMKAFPIDSKSKVEGPPWPFCKIYTQKI